MKPQDIATKDNLDEKRITGDLSRFGARVVLGIGAGKIMRILDTITFQRMPNNRFSQCEKEGLMR